MAGVSTATVSRALANKPGVSGPMRNRIVELVDQLEYGPSAAARSLVSRRSETLGLVIPRSAEYVFGNPYYLEVIRGVADQCDARGYSLLLSTSITSSYLRLFRTGRVDGIVLINPLLNDPQVLELMQHGYPFVVVGRLLAEVPNAYSVEVDDFDGVRQVMEHLFSLNHKTIGYIGGPLSYGSNLDRYEAFRYVLGKRAIPMEERLIYCQKGSRRQDAYEAMKDLLTRAPGVTAVFVMNDFMAIGALEAARGLDVSVPDDISIAGFDDSTLARYVTPPLTTVRQPAYDIGTWAARTLLDHVEGKPVLEKRVKLPVSLVVRGSTGPARSK